MYICICQGVTEGAIREAAKSGAVSLDDLHVELGVAASCGTCACAAEDLLEELRDSGELRPRLTLVVSR